MVIRHAIEFQELRVANRVTLRRNQEQFTSATCVGLEAMQEVFELLRSVAGWTPPC